MYRCTGWGGSDYARGVGQTGGTIPNDRHIPPRALRAEYHQESRTTDASHTKNQELSDLFDLFDNTSRYNKLPCMLRFPYQV